MRKMLYVLMFILCVFSMSFIYRGKNINIDIRVNKNELVIINDDSNEYFSLEEALCYELLTKNNVYTYRIILPEGIFIAIDKVENNYIIFGYNESKRYTFTKVISSFEKDLLIDRQKLEFIMYENENYYELLNIFNEYLKLDNEINDKRGGISTYSFDYALESELKKITSTDEYLENYVPKKYYEYAAKTDDDIVKIIPKEFFVDDSLVHSYLGKEYYFYMKKYKTNYNNETIYFADVVVFDIDVLDPDVVENDIYGIPVNIYSLSNMTQFQFSPKVNHRYICVTNSSAFAANHIDNFQNEVVVSIENFGDGSMPDTYVPKYFVIEDFMYSLEYKNEKKSCQNGIESVGYKLVPETQIVDNTIDLNISACVGILSEILSFANIPVASTAIDTINLFWDALVEIKNIQDKSKEEQESHGIYKFKYESVLPTKYLIVKPNRTYSDTFYTELYDSQLYNLLRESRIFNYSYLINIKEKNCDSNCNLEYCNNSVRDRIIRFTGVLYDFDGQILEYREYDKDSIVLGDIPINDCYTLIDYNIYTLHQNILLTGSNAGSDLNFIPLIDDIETRTSISFSLDNNSKKDLVAVKANKDGYYCFSIPTNCYVDVYKTTIRYDSDDVEKVTLISTSNSMYGKLSHIVIKLEKDRWYIFSAGVISGAATNFQINKVTIGYFTYPDYMQYTYSVNGLNDIHCLSFNNYGIYSIYSFLTSSYLDTIIFIYNSDLSLIAYDDNSLYDPNEDEPDRNATVYEPIGDNEEIFIVCQTSYGDNEKVILKLIKW